MAFLLHVMMTFCDCNGCFDWGRQDSTYRWGHVGDMFLPTEGGTCSHPKRGTCCHLQKRGHVPIQRGEPLTSYRGGHVPIQWGNMFPPTGGKQVFSWIVKSQTHRPKYCFLWHKEETMDPPQQFCPTHGPWDACGTWADFKGLARALLIFVICEKRSKK